ncbi:hypothetical protein ACFL4T_00790, partial [candidate division KSB1 bacterium]
INRLNIEYQNLIMNNILLSRLSGLTGGKYIHISDFDKQLPDIAIEKFEEVEENTFSIKRSITVLFIIVFFLSLEWFLRKRWGLL